MKPILIVSALVALVVAFQYQKNPNHDHLYRLARGTPAPTATPRPEHPHAHSIEMPHAHFHWLNPPGSEEAIMARFERSDPAMIAALQEGELVAFETAEGHPPVKWPDNPRLK